MEDKKLILCENCHSGNIELRYWVNPNNNSIGDLAGEGDCDDTWCCDCETHPGVYASELKPDAKLIGYQVIGDEYSDKEGEIHPDMDASFCVYSLKQAREMLNVNPSKEWKLRAVWEGDIEEPTIMFRGNPR